jgi:16S rRNA (guanine527-N7)-methyltransferase
LRLARVNFAIARPDPPAAAEDVFGDRLEWAARYADLLASEALTRGLIGPREVPRLWDRHLLNCAVVTDLLPHEARVVDAGSGAGLPGLVFALRRPDLRVDLVEPLLRRTTFLDDAVQKLQLSDRVRVVRARVEDVDTITLLGHAAWVTARAVAPLDRLVRWCLPLLRPDGALLAIKGSSAGTELAEHRSTIQALGGRDLEVRRCGIDVLAEPTTVVVVRRGTMPPRRRKGPT